MLPSEHYQQLVSQRRIQHDAKQAQIMQQLDDLYHELCADTLKTRIKKCLKIVSPITGFYFWGGVGTGKSFVMDTFFHCLPFEQKLRLHFHGFMELVHYELGELKQQDPLKCVAKRIAKRAKVLCLDELFVNDIADAMILAELFELLIKLGVCLLFTSNIKPQLLYKNGIQRDRFMPAIALIEQSCRIIHLDKGVDYRQQKGELSKQHFLTPCNEQTNKQFWNYYLKYSEADLRKSGQITIHKRPISYMAKNNGVIACDFLALCNVPRSQRDYLILAQQFHTILVDGVRPVLEKETNIALCFIHLIDVLYDHKIRLIIRSHCTISEIYPKGRLAMSFARTQSRLTEMQSLDWGC